MLGIGLSLGDLATTVRGSGSSVTPASFLAKFGGYWKLDDNPADISWVDSTANANDLIVQAGLPTSVSGKVGNAVSLDGNSYASCSITPSIQTNSSSKLSVCFCLNFSVASDYAVAARTNSWAIEINPEGHIYFQPSGAAPSIGELQTDLTGGWHDAVWVFDGTQTDADLTTQNNKRLKLYLDGTLQSLDFGGTTIPASLAVDNGEQFVGALNVNPDEPLFAKLDELGISLQALTQADATFYHNKTSAGLSPIS